MKTAILELNNPEHIKSKYVKLFISEYVGKGYKSTDITIKLNFLCDRPDILFGQFQVMKNKEFFKKYNITNLSNK